MRSTLHTLLALLFAATNLAACGSEPTPEEAWPVPGRAALPECPADNDGSIRAEELDFSPGGQATYAVQAEGGPQIDPRGESGQSLWDFRGQSFDRLEELPLSSPRGRWFASHFPEATLTLPLSGTEAPASLVLADRGSRIEILGMASEAADQQLMIYDDPVPAFLRFPLELGMAWAQELSLAEGSVWQGFSLEGLQDSYRMEVLGQGRLLLDGMELDKVLELRMSLERRGQGRVLLQTEETYLLHECLGVVGRRSEPDGPWWVIWYPM